MKQEMARNWLANGTVKNCRIIEAFLKIKREDFILPEYIEEAYRDYPLPLMEGQTISQPTTVMIMLEALELKQGMKVLEVGAGSGWNAALMARIVGDKGRVYAVEIVPELARFAEENIQKTGLRNVEVIKGDGSIGYGKKAPYDRIIVTAACPALPKELVEQLKEDGIIVAPVDSFLGQKMVKVVKNHSHLKKTYLGMFSFVPLRGLKGFQKI